MRVLFYIYTLIVIALTPIYGQQAYRTDIMDKVVKTLQVRQFGKPMSPPCISLPGKNQIEINFDILSDGFQYLAYSVTHCDADWQPSSLSPIEYMKGFQGMPIEDFANSLATTTSYTNYQLLLPNDEIQFKVSGNYAIKVYDESNPEKVFLTACFYIYEPLISISASFSGNTEIDTNEQHQQLSFSINHPQYPILHPQSDLKIWIHQNNRLDNAVTNLLPSLILNKQILFEHNQDLIFEAGNEYRRMEFLSNTYNGINVRDISFYNPYYHVKLSPDISRQTHQYDQDQNGSYLINCSQCVDPDTEADYCIVHFSLPSDLYTDGAVYILSDIFNNLLDEKSKMDYNTVDSQYEKSVLLKQGHYNYLYVFVPNDEKQGTTGLFEGNFYQTENEYSIFVYHCPMDLRYDRLIGVQFLSSGNRNKPTQQQ